MMPEVSYPEQLSPGMITTFFKRLQTRERIIGKKEKRVGIKDSTLKTYGNRLKMFFKWLTTHRIIDTNPFNEIKMPQPVFTDHRALKGSEIKIILGAIAQYSPSVFLLRRDVAMISILTFCGLRRNELISLEVLDLDLYTNMLTVRGATSKSKVTRIVPINLHLRKCLTEYLDERKKAGYKNPYLFVSSRTDSQLTKHGLKHWVERLSTLSGVKFHVHRFRHTFATNLAMQDVGAIKIQKLMGHTDLMMTQTYLRSISTKDMREDINKLSFENLE
jgi:integrase/recombinase XerD